MVKISEDFVEEQVEKIKKKDYVEAVSVVGSYAREPNANHNDLDFYIIVEGEWRRRVTEEVEGIVVEKFFNSIKHSKAYLTEELAGTEWWSSYHWYKNADVRYDPKNIFEELVDKADVVGEKNLDDDIDKDKLLYQIWDMRQDLDTGDIGQKRYVMYKLFDFLVQKIYIMEDEIPVKENYRIKRLEKFDGYMYKLAQEFLNSSSTLEQEKTLDKIIEHLTRDIGEPGPEWKTEKDQLN